MIRFLFDQVLEIPVTLAIQTIKERVRLTCCSGFADPAINLRMRTPAATGGANTRNQ